MDEQGTQRLDVDQDGDWLPLADAATHLGVSVKTARRRLKGGELLSRQVTTPHGLAYEVWLPSKGSVVTQTSSPNAVGTQRVDDVTTVELVRLVDRLQRENRDLAGMVGSLQQRLVYADDRIRALEAPKRETAEIAPERDSERVAADPSETPARARHRAPWWMPWRRATS